MQDKYAAVWVSHSSISDFLKCPRAYYLNNVYKNPKNGHKMTIMQPSLALGQVVHSVIEALSILPSKERFNESLLLPYEKAWEKISGKLGGFTSDEQERRFKERGFEMMRKVMANPGPLKNKAVKIHQNLPHFWLSEKDNIILCGKIDWLEYLECTDSVCIIDFKTGKFQEKDNSLQLPIYYLLATHCQKRPVTKAGYWYLDQSLEPVEVMLPDLHEAAEKILAIAKQIKLQRQLDHFKCKFANGCISCQPYEKILQGKAEFVGVNDFNQDIYIFSSELEETQEESSIL